MTERGADARLPRSGRWPSTQPPARGRHAEFGANWWARSWISALEALGWESRLQRGRSYARSGQVRSIEVHPGRVEARVKGSRPRPYVVRIGLTALTDEQWDTIITALAREARFAASLLSGELPPTIEAVFRSVGVPLFPDMDSEFTSECSCPDWANPCKHIAAVHYVLGSEFDRDPFVLLRLRGRAREALLGELRARRQPDQTGAVTAAPSDQRGEAADGWSDDPPLTEQLDSFWAAGDELAELRFSIGPPRVPEAVLKRLGRPFPPRDGERPALPELARLYGAISEAAIRTAYEDDA